MLPWFDMIYEFSPVIFQETIISLYGRHLGKQRYGSYYFEEFSYLRQKTEKVDIEQEKLERLNEFLSFCNEHSPYYRNLFAEHNLTLPLTSLEEYKKFPILEKDTLRARMEEIQTDVEAPIVGRTGGTTGKSLQINFTIDDFQRRLAHVDYFKEQHGFKRGMRRASFTSRRIVPVKQKKAPFWRYNREVNQMLFSVVHLTPQTLPDYVKQLNKFKPEALDGFPSAMLEVARYVRENNIELTFKPVAIFPTSETLTPTHRKFLEDVFGARIYNHYGSSEGAPLITECQYGNMHLHIESGMLEQVDESGEVLVTSFTTKGTPLVRYRIGDVIQFSSSSCSCGHGGPVITSIQGRKLSYIELPNGRKIPEATLVSSTIQKIPNAIVQVQFIQDSCDKIRMLYVKDYLKFKEEHKERLRLELERLLGEEVSLSVEEVEMIPREPNGKVLVVKRMTTA